MATGIIGTIVGTGTLSYSPNTSAKIKITVVIANTGSVTMNGVPIGLAGAGSIALEHWVGAGQTVVFVVFNGSTLILSALEG